MPSIREKYFYLKNLNNKYLPENIILDLLMLVNGLSSNASLILSFDDECKNIDKLDEYVKRISDGYPYQYVVNKSIFNSLEFYVDESVLIPRNETEQLVNIVSKIITDKYQNQNINIFDVCTGSGCIGLSLKYNHPKASIYLSDISKDALKVCSLNKDKLNLDVSILEGDLLTPFISNDLKCDVLVSNPPYIPSIDTVDSQTLKYEPHLALFASPSTYFYEEIFKQIDKVTNGKFLLAFEIGEDMEDSLTALCKQYFPYDKFNFYKDIYDKTRFLIIIRE